MATVMIPTPLRKFTNNTTTVTIQSTRISDLVVELTTKFPNLKRHLIDPNGKVSSFINIFVENDDIRNLNWEQTEIKEGTVVSIVPAIAGG
jgi:molybdopterin synthase sulfur carrier subunit